MFKDWFDIDDVRCEFINQTLRTSNCIFLTWKAGTGKSATVDFVVNEVLKWKKKVQKLAPTWVAALNIWWITIHKFFKFKQAFLPHSTYLDDKIVEPITKTDVFLIDEISMVRADMLDAINFILMQRYCRVNWCPIDEAPVFGWKQMIFVWDLYQLPPVVVNDEWEKYYERNYDYRWHYFFDANVFRWKLYTNITTDIYKYEPIPIEPPVISVLELQKVFRQKDPIFIKILDSIREWILTSEDLTNLNQRCRYNLNRVDMESVLDGAVTICLWNKRKDEINNQKLSLIQKPESKFFGKKTWTFFVDQSLTAETIVVKEWAKIMMIANDPDWRWVNWSMGIFIWEDTQEIEIYDQETERYIEKEVDWAIIELAKWERYFVTPYTRYNYDIIEKRNDRSEFIWYWVGIAGTFAQVPFILAFAITAHKSQWQSLEKVYIELENKVYSCWQLYVMLSRCKTFEWLAISRPIRQDDINVDDRVLTYMSMTKNKFELDDEAISTVIKIKDESDIKINLYVNANGKLAGKKDNWLKKSKKRV